MTIKFSAKSPGKKSDAVEVRYDCACGCHPVARYTRGSTEAGHEHCCCGIVHFAGQAAESQLRSYLAERKADGRDTPETRYSLALDSVRAPWGESIEIAYAVPTSGSA
ncbi:MAG: hypothetical protein HYY34_05370 [Chloroflexi bacterium]|nr:hypothetical protein [Chloroflexota bacterium]